MADILRKLSLEELYSKLKKAKDLAESKQTKMFNAINDEDRQKNFKATLEWLTVVSSIKNIILEKENKSFKNIGNN